MDCFRNIRATVFEKIIKKCVSYFMIKKTKSIYIIVKEKPSPNKINANETKKSRKRSITTPFVRLGQVDRYSLCQDTFSY